MPSIRRRMQLIFQDPMASLNPRRTIRRIVLEPMLFHRVAESEADAEARARMIFARFSLPSSCLDRYPHELSGGQRQTSRHRARRAARARFRPRGRDRLRARRLDSSSRPEPLEGAVARPRPFHGLHQPRPLRHPGGVRPGLCPAQRAGRRRGRVRPRLRCSEGRVYPRASGRDPLAEDRPRLARLHNPRRERRGIGRREIGRRRPKPAFDRRGRQLLWHPGSASPVSIGCQRRSRSADLLKSD